MSQTDPKNGIILFDFTFLLAVVERHSPACVVLELVQQSTSGTVGQQIADLHPPFAAEFLDVWFGSQSGIERRGRTRDGIITHYPKSARTPLLHERICLSPDCI